MVKETRASWNDESDALLADLVQEQVLEGNRSQSGLKPAAWADINKKFNAGRAAELIMSTNQLKTRDQHFRKLHKLFLKLKDTSGFGWDAEHSVPTAAEDVWDVFVQKYPLAKQFRGRGWPLFNILHEVYINSTPTGSHSLWGPQEESGSSSIPQAAAEQLSPQGLKELDSGPHTPDSGSSASAGVWERDSPKPELPARKRRALNTPQKALRGLVAHKIEHTIFTQSERTTETMWNELFQLKDFFEDMNDLEKAFDLMEARPFLRHQFVRLDSLEAKASFLSEQMRADDAAALFSRKAKGKEPEGKDRI